jgi:hypothetical protein
MVSKGPPPDVVERTEMKIGEGISGHVALHGQPLIVEDVKAHPTFRRRNRERYYTSTLISAPLLRNGVLLGVINISAASQLVGVADAELYRAKSRGRNRGPQPHLLARLEPSRRPAADAKPCGRSIRFRMIAESG